MGRCLTRRERSRAAQPPKGLVWVELECLAGGLAGGGYAEGGQGEHGLQRVIMECSHPSPRRMGHLSGAARAGGRWESDE